MQEYKGKAHVFGKNINTDYIIAGKYKFKSLDMRDLSTHLMEDLRPGFYKEIEPGDFIVAGENFGMGSSREQAPGHTGGRMLGGHREIVRPQIDRNCINVGLPLIECDTSGIEEGDELNVDLEKGIVHNLTKGQDIKAIPLPKVMVKILNDGGLAEHFKKYGGFNLD